VSHWNHRVIRLPVVDAAADEPKEFFTVAETHYDDEGVPYGYGDPEHNPLHSDSLEDLRATLERMLKALTAPVLSDDDMRGQP
jgi:hypothetical protein